MRPRRNTALFAIPHHTCTSAPRYRCIWASEEQLAPHLEGIQDGDMCSDGRKKEFPRLLKKLWEASFKAQHLQTGFRKAGLCPLSKDSIPKSSYAPSIPHTSQSQLSKTPTQVTMHDDTSDPHIVHVQVSSCCECHSEAHIAPARLYLRG